MPAVLWMLSAACALAQSSPALRSGSDAAPALDHWISLSNKTVRVLARLRDIEPVAVKLKFGPSLTGPFEIDLAGAGDLKREAKLLSRGLGLSAAVILDEAAANGLNRTNSVFRNGELRQAILPLALSGLAAGGKRLSVWPDSGRASAPKTVPAPPQPDGP